MNSTLTIRKFAAIDIGSNAMRLLIANVLEQEGKEVQINKNELIRVPIRLGQDAFTNGEISQESISRMTDAFQAFQLLMNVYGVERYKACATSAMREAYNGQEIAQLIEKKTGIEIEIIDGKTEAAIIANSGLTRFMERDEPCLFVDVGGGSTEFSLFDGGVLKVSRSFKNGTVRLLNGMVPELVWDEMHQWIHAHTHQLDNLVMIGSGGNINRLFKMSGKLQDKSLSYMYLHAQFDHLSKLSYEQRIAELGLNPDRADVIIPATSIYLKAMKWSGAQQLYVPKIGLSDGMIKAMYNQQITSISRDVSIRASETDTEK
ncbi:MAG: exopolyphosphatase [Flavobacterium sp. BFFFF2]|nr:MAG: exopolyphosphatase [Flavobacterium sp. BFFFF2]